MEHFDKCLRIGSREFLRFARGLARTARLTLRNPQSAIRNPQWVAALGRACLVVSLAAMLLTLCSCGDRPGKPRTQTFLKAGSPVRISNLSLPALVHNGKGNLILSLFIHSTFPSATETHDAIAVLHSGGDGSTWKEISRIPSQVTYGVWGYDLAADAQGRLYMTWVASLRSKSSPVPLKAVMFARSDDGGDTWSQPIRISKARSGQRRNASIVVAGDNVHVAWLEDVERTARASSRETSSDVYCASSPDRGATWPTEVCVERDLNQKLSSSSPPSLCTGPNGELYCAYYSMRQYKKRQGGIWIAKSIDGGKTFSNSLHAVGPLGTVAVLQADGKLYVAAVYIRSIKSFSMQDPQTAQELRFYVSGDDGKSWSKPVRIDDDPAKEHKNNVKLVSLGAGKLFACWDDERGGVYAAVSLDGGRTWGKNVKLANRSQTGITPLDVVADPAAGTLYVVTSDVRKGLGDATYLVKVTLAAQ